MHASEQQADVEGKLTELNVANEQEPHVQEDDSAERGVDIGHVEFTLDAFEIHRRADHVVGDGRRLVENLLRFA